MKIIAVVVGAVTLSISVSATGQNQRASRLAPHLAPRVTDHEGPKAITHNASYGNHFTHDQLFTLQKRFLDNFISPNNIAQAESINSSLLAADVQGRVDVTRTFDGRELNTEYLFGLFASLASSTNNTNSFSLLGIPTAYEITHFAASQNIASASTRFQFLFPAINATIPLQIQTWNVFNAAGEISMYDATFTGWWQWAVDTLLGTASRQLSAIEGKPVSIPETVSFVQAKLATSICDIAQKHCVGPALKQYQNATQCFDYLTKQTRFGEAYELGRNTLLCRMVHQNMVPLRPEVHCPHIGPSGGGYCVDMPSYADTVGADYFTNYKFAYGNGSLTG